MEREYSLPSSQELATGPCAVFINPIHTLSSYFFIKSIVIPMLNYIIKHCAMKAYRGGDV
jgi:hypothetical protein